jgi:hypothetical protein
MRIGAGANQGIYLHAVAADLLRQIAENAEAGDHRQRLASHRPTWPMPDWQWPSSPMASSYCQKPKGALRRIMGMTGFLHGVQRSKCQLDRQRLASGPSGRFASDSR